MNQLRATTDVGGGIGRSSEIDRSKALDLYFFRTVLVEFPRLRQKKCYRKNDSPFLIVFAWKTNQRPVTSSNRLGRHYELIFRENGFSRKSEFLVFLVGRIPITRSLRSPGGLFLQVHSGD